MIYQCYAKEEDKKHLFKGGPYKGFGLEPEVNKRLFEKCPELEDPEIRMGLTEYACFLWHWRNKENPDKWFGTTSFRQVEKGFHTKFESKDEVMHYLRQHQILGWGEYELLGAVDTDKGRVGGFPISVGVQAEACHPGINDFIYDVFKEFGHTIPEGWSTQDHGFFANYWAMSKQLFNEFMEFSWPMVQWSLENVHESKFYKEQPEFSTVTNAKATGYFMERLFILWYLIKGITPYSPIQEPFTLFSTVQEAVVE